MTSERARRAAAAPPVAARRAGVPWGAVLVYLLCAVVAVVTLGPVLWMIVSSLKGPAEIGQVPPSFWPREPQFGNYVRIFTARPFLRFMLNSFVVASAVTLAALLFHAMAAYALARLRFPGREAIFLGMVSTMMVPFSVLLIPLFLLVRSLGWLDTYQGLIVPSIFHAFGIFLLRQFYLGLPRELEEAAVIDGDTPAGIFWHIALPLSRPILSTLAVFFWLTNWNNYLWPLVVTRSRDMMVVQVAVASFSGEYSSNWELILAASTVAAVPGLLLFLFFQRYLIEGIKLSGIK